MKQIFEIIKTALSAVDFIVLDGDEDTVIVRDLDENKDYQIKMTEIEDAK